MKKQFATFIAITLASASMLYAQDTSSQEASSIPESPDQSEVDGVIIIEEPSGAQPGEVPAPPPTPPDVSGAPVDPSAGAPGLAEPESDTDTVTVTVSQSFTNAQNAITIVGKVSSEEEKQRVQEALSQALPGKEINNHLMVAGPQIAEPAGAERPESERDDAEETNLDEDEDADVERDFELQGQEQPSPESLP